MRLLVPSLAACLLAVTPVSAQETRVAEEGHVPPSAQIEDVAWLAGTWSGTGIQGGPAHETWLPPSGDTMVGVFVQEVADGGIMFTEHMYLREVDGTIQLNLKHFNADLTGWEERDEMLTFRLIAAEHCALYFSALTFRCANRENTDDGLVVAVRMQSEGDEINELMFNFAPMTGTEENRYGRCADAQTTLDSNECYAGILDDAQARRDEYLAAAIERYPRNPEITRQIAASDAAYSAYIDAECGTVYDYWRSGTIRGVMYLTCRIDLVDRGTHNIWRNWLTYMDSSPPILPEPEPTL